MGLLTYIHIYIHTSVHKHYSSGTSGGTATSNMIIELKIKINKKMRLHPSERNNCAQLQTCQYIIAMGDGMYCRTCATPPREVLDKGMVDIFANVKLIQLLNTLNEWQLDIMQDDDLPQCICETCELTLKRIDDFRIQATRAKEYLKIRFRSTSFSTTKMPEDDSLRVEGVVISDNENDLHDETNYDGADDGEMCNRAEAISMHHTAMHIDEQLINANNVILITKGNENEKKQLADYDEINSSLNAVSEQSGELLFDSNIESSKPPEFQVVLIEEEEETQLQWFVEDEHGEGLRADQTTNTNVNTIPQLNAHTQQQQLQQQKQCEGISDNNKINQNSAESTVLRNVLEQHTIMNAQHEGKEEKEGNKIKLNKDNSIEKKLVREKLQKDNSKTKHERATNTDNLKNKLNEGYDNSIENSYKQPTITNELLKEEVTRNVTKNFSSDLLLQQTFADHTKGQQLACERTETTATESTLYSSTSNNNDLTLFDDHQMQLKEFQALLSSFDEQVVSSSSLLFDTNKTEPNNYASDEFDIQSTIFMNDLTLQMINANINLVEEENLQIDELETLLAAIGDNEDGSLKFFKSKYEILELDDKLSGGVNKQTINENARKCDAKIFVYGGTTETTPPPLFQKIENLNKYRSSLHDADANVTVTKNENNKNIVHDQLNVKKWQTKKMNTNHEDGDILGKKFVGSGGGGPIDKEMSNLDCTDCDNTITYLLSYNNFTTTAPVEKTPSKRTAVDTAAAIPTPTPVLLNKKPKTTRQNTNTTIRCHFCVCKIAQKPIFATKQLLEDHIAAIHDDKERPYSCTQCLARYRTRSGCVAHINSIHLKKFDYCKLCNKCVAGGGGQMRMHMERNHTHGNYTCEICHLELKNISLYNFKYHKRWHDENKLLRCDLCEKAFVTRTHLMAHKVTHTRHGDFLCTHCGKSTRSKWELRVHLHAIHGEGDAPLKCNYCDEKFTQHIQKRAHLERRHPEELAKSRVPCMKCEKQFSTEINLHRHIKQQHDNNDNNYDNDNATRPYQGFMCAHCPRKYRSKYALIKHLRVHTRQPDKQYSCPDCHMHFKYFCELDRHDLHHHATVRPYKCDECCKRFATRTALEIHRRVHEAKGRNFRCPECNQRFKFEKSLNLHRASHTTMRHSCDVCNKSYIRLNQLKNHTKRFHKITSDAEE